MRPKGRFIKGTHWRPEKPWWNREWLYNEYVNKKRSSYEIATEYGCISPNILKWLRKHNIPIRSTSEARAIKYWGSSGPANGMYGRRGAAHHSYKDGSSPERYIMFARSEGKEFLKSVYKRDGYKCRRCGKPKTVPKSIHAHHIKPWAGNPELRFDIDNAVTLCRSCHEWVHSNDNLLKEWLD